MSVYIVNAVRTAGGGFGGSLQEKTAPDLGAVVINDVLKRSGVPGEALDEVIFAMPGRQALVRILRVCAALAQVCRLRFLQFQSTCVVVPASKR